MPPQKRRSATPARSPHREPTPKLGALRRYVVSGLFGHRKIEFTLEEDEPTLLTGVNGTGKSTVLRTIDAVSTAQWHNLFSIPFVELTLEFENGKQFKAHQNDETCELSLTDHPTWSVPKRQLLANFRDSLRFAERDVATGFRIATPPILSRLSRSDVERIWSHVDRDVFEDVFSTLVLTTDLPKPPDWIGSLPTMFPVFFITDQRLVIEPAVAGDKSRTEAVSTKVAAEEAARHIAREIAHAQANYASRSQSLDRDFPRRVLEAMSEDLVIGNDELRLELEQLAQQRDRLQKAGLLPSSEKDDFEYLDIAAANARAVILTYVHDTRNKLEVLEPLRRRLALFTDFLNLHYRATKQIRVDQQEGFVITVEGHGAPLSPAKLSSGEQQILVLAHHILFRAAENTLVLIDEPELSLHVVWQSTLVDDLSQMGRERDLSFLLATHSPTLIAGREDLKRSLDK